MVIYSPSKIEQVRQAILLKILCGELHPGQRLLEAKLASELDVSQATVNAALQDLHNQGLVTKRLNRSTNVCRYTRAEIEKLFRVRLALELVAVEAVAENWSEEGERRLREQVDNLRRAARTKDIVKWCIADYTFHQTIYKLTGNSFLIQAAQAVASAPFAYILCDQPVPLPADYLSMAEDHQDMITAMAEGPGAAARVARERIELWLQYSLRALEKVAEKPVAAGPSEKVVARDKEQTSST